jgi:2,3-bisphosphoglycerate-independent phosphoglycerate mutase
VPSYDSRPRCRRPASRALVTGAIGDEYGFCVVNLANPDMVGHTGVIPAVVRAVEAADAALGEIVHATRLSVGVCLVTADHGNAEQMLEADGVSPHTAHTTNLVPSS